MANFNSATAVLGLMPTLLSTIVPSIAETILLSVYRPRLSFVITLGAPSIWPARLLEYNDLMRVLRGVSNNARGSLLAVNIHDRFKWATGLLSALQYVLAAGAVVHVFWTSITLGRNTILSWGCTTMFGSLLWTTLAGAVHRVAGLDFAYVRCSSSAHKHSNGTAEEIDVARSKKSNRSVRMLRSFAGLLRKKVTLCSEQIPHLYDENAKVPPLAVAANVLADCGAFIHQMFGIIIFSSLKLLSVWDVLNFVLCRYVVSAVVCRLILVEIPGLRRERTATKYQGL